MTRVEQVRFVRKGPFPNRKASSMNKSRDSFTNISMIVIGLALAITFASIVTYRVLVRDILRSAPQQNEQFSYHFALVADAYDDPFWNEVWTAANREAMENDAYVEWLGNGLAVDYSLAELMEIAINAKVDGILIRADNTEDVFTGIQQAVERGIPVITLMVDALDSGRQGYVGFNSYELGQLYGAQLLAHIPPDGAPAKAMMLINDETADNGWNIVYSSIVETVAEWNMTLAIKTFDNANVFSVEEGIRELVMSESEAPDILLCMDSTTTLCAYQAAVDYNRVGKVAILGNYITDQILSAVQKDIIQATIAVDANKVGTTGVGALLECINFGRASDYTAVDFIVITPENVQAYMSSRESVEADDA